MIQYDRRFSKTPGFNPAGIRRAGFFVSGPVGRIHQHKFAFRPAFLKLYSLELYVDPTWMRGKIISAFDYADCIFV
jgi:hypothetical protein